MVEVEGSFWNLAALLDALDTYFTFGTAFIGFLGCLKFLRFKEVQVGKVESASGSISYVDWASDIELSSSTDSVEILSYSELIDGILTRQDCET